MRRANANDLQEIAEIEKQCFPDLTAYSKRQLSYLIMKANSATLVETDNGTLCGFVIVLYRRGSHVGCIETIDVNPTCRKKGVASRLLLAAEEDMKHRGMKVAQLEVSERNENAIKFYHKAGYLLKERLGNFYRLEHYGTRDAVRMIKCLDMASKSGPTYRFEEP